MDRFQTWLPPRDRYRYVPSRRRAPALLTAHVLIVLVLIVILVLILVLVILVLILIVLVLVLIVLVVVLVVLIVLIVVLIVLHIAVLLFVIWDYNASMRHSRAFYSARRKNIAIPAAQSQRKARRQS